MLEFHVLSENIDDVSSVCLLTCLIVADGLSNNGTLYPTEPGVVPELCTTPKSSPGNAPVTFTPGVVINSNE